MDDQNAMRAAINDLALGLQVHNSIFPGQILQPSHRTPSAHYRYACFLYLLQDTLSIL